MDADDEPTPPVVAEPSYTAKFTPRYQTYTVTKGKAKKGKAVVPPKYTKSTLKTKPEFSYQIVASKTCY